MLKILGGSGIFIILINSQKIFFSFLIFIELFITSVKEKTITLHSVIKGVFHQFKKHITDLECNWKCK